MRLQAQSLSASHFNQTKSFVKRIASGNLFQSSKRLGKLSPPKTGWCMSK